MKIESAQHVAEAASVVLGFCDSDVHLSLVAVAAAGERTMLVDACAAYRITTRGLVRFGHPELVVDDIDCANRLVAMNVLRAVAQHLLTSHWDWLRESAPAARPPVRRLAAMQQISGTAFADFWATKLWRDSPFAVSLTKRDDVLRVGSVDGLPLNAWLADIESELSYVVGSPPDDFDNYQPLVRSET